MDTLSYSSFRTQLAKILDKVNDNHEPILITRQNGPPAVMMSLENFHAYKETSYLLVSPKNANKLSEAISEIEAGRTIESETIEQFEPMHPGEFIKEVYMFPFGIGSNQLARELKLSKSLVSRLINGLTNVTPDIALRLSSVLGRSAESWLRMQDNYYLWNAKQHFNSNQFKPLQLTYV